MSARELRSIAVVGDRCFDMVTHEELDPSTLEPIADPRPAIKGNGRVLNLHDRIAGVPELIMCPRCEGQAFDKGSCGMCGNTGYLRSHDGERLDFVEMVQILATFALATNMDVKPKEAL